MVKHSLKWFERERDFFDQYNWSQHVPNIDITFLPEWRECGWCGERWRLGICDTVSRAAKYIDFTAFAS
jgi:hypothetical protein